MNEENSNNDWEKREYTCHNCELLKLNIHDTISL